VIGTRRNRLHSIGVSVNDTNPDTRIAMPMTTANSLNTRPTTPPMKNTGMKTATSEIVIDMIVKVISREPLSAACNRAEPRLGMADNVLEHNDRIVDHKATASVSAISETLSRL